MTITIIGTGFVGVVSSAVFASLGHTVYGLDIDKEKLKRLRNGKTPFYEPGLEDLLQQEVESGRLLFTDDYEEAISESEIIMICTGTPSNPDGTVDLRYVFSASESLAPHLKKDTIVAIKSTVPPSTGKAVTEIISKHTSVPFTVVSLPEFLKEGSAVYDTLHPDRIVIGATDSTTIKTLTALHTPLTKNIVVMRPESAQMCKYASNAYLATRITFINQIANLCERNGADIDEVIQGMGGDARIGSHYWYPGLGYGGSCFPKDVKELAAYADSIGLADNLMIVINELNDSRIDSILKRFGEQLGGWKDKSIALLGLSFKPNTDDLREAPSTLIVPRLIKQGVQSIRGHDPLANESARMYFKDTQLEIYETYQEAIKNADAVLMLVEWPSYAGIDPEDFARLLKPGAWIFDTRNQLKPHREQLEKLRLNYQGIGIR